MRAAAVAALSCCGVYPSTDTTPFGLPHQGVATDTTAAAAVSGAPGGSGAANTSTSPPGRSAAAAAAETARSATTATATAAAGSGAGFSGSGGGGGGSGSSSSVGSGKDSSSLLTIVKAQIVFLLSILTEENFERNQLEIRSLCDQHGTETYLHFIRRLLIASAPQLSAPSSPRKKVVKPDAAVLSVRLLLSEVPRIARDPFLAERFREAVDRGEGEVFRTFVLQRFVEKIGLSPLERVILASALVSSSHRREALYPQAASMIVSELEAALDALRIPSASLSLDVQPGGQGGDVDLTPAQLAKILSNLLSDTSNDNGNNLIATSGMPQQVLDPAQRRALVNAVVQRTGHEQFAQILQQALPSVRINPAKTFVQFLVEVGPQASSNVDVVRSLLARFGYTDATPPDAGAVVDMLSALFEVPAEVVGGGAVCDFGTLVQALSSFQAPVAWSEVVRAFGSPDRSLPMDDLALEAFAVTLATASREGDPTPAVAGLWGHWDIQIRQLRFIDALLTLPPEVFNFVNLPGRRIVTVDDMGNASPTIKALAAGVQGSPWNSLDLIATLAQAAATSANDIKLIVTELLDKAVKASAELVLMGLVQVPKPWNVIHSELASRLLSMFFAGHPSHQLVFMRIWQVDEAFLIQTFRDFYAENAMNVTRLLDVAQDLKILDRVLDVRPFEFALDIAALASRREYLNLDKWLQDMFNKHGTAFVRATLEFLDFKARADLAKQDPQAEQNNMPLTAQTVAIFLRVIRANGEALSAEEIETFKQIRNLCLQLHPRLMNLAPNSADQEPGLSVVSFSAEVHSEVDGYYQRMYEEKISIDDVICLLQNTKASEDPRDHEVFACMLHTLFDEYRWFEMYYPPKELAMTGILFGSIIQYQLVDYIPLGIAIRYVLDALRTPPESNMFRFGVQALLRFQGRLPEWPQLAQALLAIPHLLQTHPEIANVVRASLAQGANGVGTEGGGQATGQELLAGVEQADDPAQRPVFTAVNLDPAYEAELDPAEMPDEDVSDKILFIINNLAPSNVRDKTDDLKEWLRDEHCRWFSNYLVLQRVSIEPNNHALYMQLLDLLDKAPLLKHILNETLAKVKVLLNSEKTVQSTTERTLLKNLGSWLGGLTLARNKPILHKNIAFKDLLIQGYDRGRLIVAIPFVCKVLEHSAKSSVFQPPNPWLMGVIRLLVELYQFAELKLNLKFEIEVLCKALNVTLEDIRPTMILRSRPPVGLLPPAGSAAPDGRPELVHELERLSMTGAQAEYAGQAQGTAGVGAMGPTTTTGAAGAVSAGAGAATTLPFSGVGGQTGAGAAAVPYGDSLTSVLANLANYITFNPGLTMFANNPTLKRLVHAAIASAIREIIAPVVERSVTIASISTRELVLKDFAMEGNEEKMRKAAHHMAQNLAGSLAMVTCKEPLRISMLSHVKSLLVQNGFTEQNVPEQALLFIMGDNIDLACSVIEKAAMEKAIPEVDHGLQDAYASRREHRSRSNGFYWDSAALSASHYGANLPDLLRLKPNGLHSQQLRVYEDFGKLPSQASPPGGAGAAAVAEQRATPSSFGYSGIAGRADLTGSFTPSSPVPGEVGLDGSVTGTPGLMTAQQSLEKFHQYIAELEKLLSQSTTATLMAVPENHDIRLVLRQVPLIAAQSVSRDETALAFSQKVVQLLYKSESALAREVYVILLERLCEVSVKVAKEVTAWLIYAEDERKFNVQVTVALIRAGLINIVEQDVQLAKFIARDMRPSVIDFTAKLALECLREPACATRAQLANSIEAIVRAVQRGKSTEAADQLLDELQLSATPIDKHAQANAELREQLAYCFAEWVRLFQHSPSSEKSFISFVTQLQEQGILKGEEISSLFFRVCTEVGVDSYIKQKATGGTLATGIFSPIDAFSKLVVLMIKYHADPTGVNNEQAKVHYLTKILSIVVLVLAQSHEELGTNFQQKPFFRFFSSLLHDLHLIEGNLHSAYFHCLVAISNTLNTLQPSFFPGFTFSWMALISHRLFMPKLLLADNCEGWAPFHRPLSSLFKFLAPFLRTAELRETSRSLYKGALRILLVLLHDFPEFLSAYHHSLCDLVPTSCIQLRNLVLSAFPRDRRLPDPFLSQLKPEYVVEMNESPTILSDYVSALQPAEFKASLDQYLLNRGPQVFLSTLRDRVLSPSVRDSDIAKGETKFNIPLINALVVYVGNAAIERARPSTPSNGLIPFSAQDSAVDIMQQLLVDLDPEGRYLFLSAITNQLRYPNAHTHYFSCLMLYLFGETDYPIIHEQFTRVLLERILAVRPHPWGLLQTLIIALRDPRLADTMMRGPAEIERLVQHVRNQLTI